MARCKNHPQAEAVTQCSACGVHICGECIAPGEGDAVCFDCSIAHTERQLGHEHQTDTPPPSPTETAAGQLSPAMKAILVLGLLVILGELAVILLMSKPGITRDLAPPSLSPEQAATVEATTDTIAISQSLEAYRATHGHYPADLSEIASSLPAPLRDRLLDPSTVYTTDGKGGYSLEIKGNAPAPVMFGTALKAPMVKGVEQ